MRKALIGLAAAGAIVALPLLTGRLRRRVHKLASGCRHMAGHCRAMAAEFRGGRMEAR